MSAGASAAAAGAAAQQRRNHEEEEETTPMNTDPSGNVEYKIIRSATNAFREPALFQQTLQEEARAGWELVEKLDNGRVRLRRSIDWRKKDDPLLGQDPYRIHIGIKDWQLGLGILAAVFGTILIVILVIILLVK